MFQQKGCWFGLKPCRGGVWRLAYNQGLFPMSHPTPGALKGNTDPLTASESNRGIHIEVEWSRVVM
jgi:hypothetical protein